MEEKVLGGRYQVVDVSTHGLKCHDAQSDTFVWLKPLPDEISGNPTLMAEALRRCEALKAINHEGIARMLDVLSLEDGKAYMVIEYVEGITLRRWMHEHRQDGGVVPAIVAMPLLKQLASALDTAHTFNEIHRHLMPECIMVNEKGKIKLLNLGIPYVGSDNAWMLEPWKNEGWEAFYRAPEQWRGQICTPWTDLYAMGCIAYEMLSGHVPFDIPDLNLLHGAVLLEMPPAIISLSVAAQGTIARCLAKRGSERFNSCEDYIRSLAFETTPTKTIPKPMTGKVPALSQSYMEQNAPNGGVWTPSPAAVNPYMPIRQDTGAVPAGTGRVPQTIDPIPQGMGSSIRGTTRRIPIAMPSLPPSGPIRTITKSAPTGSITGKYTKTHNITDPLDIETESSWSEENQGVKGVLLRVIMPLLLVVTIASVMYYLFIKNMGDNEPDIIIPEGQLTPVVQPNLDSVGQPEKSQNENEKDETENKGQQEEKKNSDENPNPPSDNPSSSPSGDSPSLNDGPLPKEGEKPSSPTEKELGKDTSPKNSQSDVKTVKPEDENISTGFDVNSVASAKKKKPKRNNNGAKDGLGKAMINAYLGGKKINDAKLTIGDKSSRTSMEISAFMSEKRKVEVLAEYIDREHRSFHGTKTFTIDWIGIKKINVEMTRDAGVAVILATVDGEIVDGADVYVDGKVYKTPNCEIETMQNSAERRVDVKAFYKDNTKGLMFGSQSFVIDWMGPKNIYVEMKERKAIAAEEQSVRLLPLNVDDLADDSNGNAMAASYSRDGDNVSTDKGAVQQNDGIDKPLFMELLWVAPGSFEMGSDSKDARKDEKPRHTVQLSNGFWLGKFEVTQEEYRALARYVGLDDDRSKYVGARRPVETITRKEAERWCEAVTRKERDAGRLPFGYEYRLPTEAEWEFAARGGRNSRGYLFSGSNKLIEVAWFDANRGAEDGTREVGGKEKNELGFYDMSGNVREWCHDFYDIYTLKPVTDPMGRGNRVMARGGSWRNNTNGNRVTERANYEPNKADDFIGFRVALAPVLPE